MKINEKIDLYRSLYTFLKSEGMLYLEKQSFRETIQTQTKQVIMNLPNPDAVKIEEHFIVSFAWEIISGHLENLYHLEFNDKYLHMHARMLLDAEDIIYSKEDRPTIQRYLNEDDINYVRTHYSNYAKYTLKSSRSNKIITQTDTGLELSFLMHENNETDTVIYPLSREAHLIVGGDDIQQLNTVTQTIINSVCKHYKSNEAQLVIASNNQDKLNHYQTNMYNNHAVITDIEVLIQTLSDLEKVMLDRFKLFYEHKARDLKMFNHQQINILDRLPYIVIIIDNIQIDDNEHKEKFEDLIIRITQRSRAAGIHLVMLTSKPYQKISNQFGYFIPNRLAFRLYQPLDSMALLGTKEACNLRSNEYLCNTYKQQRKTGWSRCFRPKIIERNNQKKNKQYLFKLFLKIWVLVSIYKNEI